MTQMSDILPGGADAKPLRVLIVEDSASARELFSRIVREDPRLSLMGAVGDPFTAAQRMRQEAPDVILLDMELPKMDGLTFLRRLMAQHPVPVVVCSGHAADGSPLALEALRAGAGAVVAKPGAPRGPTPEQARHTISDALRRVGQARRYAAAPMKVEARYKADVILPPTQPNRVAEMRGRIPVTDPLLCIGASTGGTEALRDVLEALPPGCPPMVIVQHMPAGFTKHFADRLDRLCAIEVRQAADGDTLHPGLALIAPGDRHLTLRRTGQQYRVALVDGPPVSRHRPSVDVMFRSAAQVAGANAVGAILTGMGDDGADGLVEMRAMGARTFAQDEGSCVVFGMPKEAIARGGACHVAALSDMPSRLLAAAQAVRDR